MNLHKVDAWDLCLVYIYIIFLCGLLTSSHSDYFCIVINKQSNAAARAFTVKRPITITADISTNSFLSMDWNFARPQNNTMQQQQLSSTEQTNTRKKTSANLSFDIKCFVFTARVSQSRWKILKTPKIASQQRPVSKISELSLSSPQFIAKSSGIHFRIEAKRRQCRVLELALIHMVETVCEDWIKSKWWWRWPDFSGHFKVTRSTRASSEGVGERIVNRKK